MSYLLAYNPYNTNLFMKNRSIDPAAQLYFNATGITGDAQQQAINNLVKSLKQSGLWSKMKAVYPFVTDNRNLLSYTEDFGNAYWGKDSLVSVTTNSTTAPDGTLTADTITLPADASSSIYTQPTVSISTTYTVSFYIKATSGQAGNTVCFRTNPGATINMITLTNDWVRYSVVVSPTSTSWSLEWGRKNSATATSFFLWGAQLELGSTATTYQPIATTQQAFISNQFKYNLKDPRDTDAAFRLVFNGGWSFSSTGATPNGVNGYADTKLVPSSVLQLNSASHSVYSRSLSPVAIMGGVNDASNYMILNNPTLTTITSQINSIGNDFITGTITNSQGLLMANRTSSTIINAWRNSTKVATDTKNTTARPTKNYYIGARNSEGIAAGFDGKQYAFYHIGDGLTDDDATNLYYYTQVFQTTLGRQVGSPAYALPAVSDINAKLYLSAIGSTTDSTLNNAVDTFIKGLKADGIYSKMKAVYPFATDNKNISSFTEDFSNGAWLQENVVITANSALSPNNTLTADTLSEGSTLNFHNIRQIPPALSGSNIVFSVYINKNTARYVRLILSGGNSAVWTAAQFDLDTLTYTGGAGTGATGSFVSASITQASNGFYRCEIVSSLGGVNITNSWISLSDGSAIVNTNNFGRVSYQGTNKSVYLWGSQLEIGSTATTYQPILGSQQSYISNQFKYNMVNPQDDDSAFRLVFNGGWTHSANGATPNGTNGYADTKLNPSLVMSNYNSHLSFYNRSNVSSTGIDVGCIADGGADNYFLQSFSVGLNGARSSIQRNNTDYAIFTPTQKQGYFLGNSTASNSQKIYQSGVLKNTNTITNTNVLPNRNVFISACNFSTIVAYSDRQTAFASIGDGLTDTEAANLYTRVQTFNQALSRQVGVPIVSDADAQAFLNSAEITDITQANAINTLVTDLKAQGLWTKMKAIYPFVGGTASTHKWNLKDPRDLDAAYRLVFNGGWTHSSTGATPNGTNGYADTKLVPSTSFNTTTFNHLSFYSRTSAASSGFDYNIGSSQTGAGTHGLVLRRSNNAAFFVADYPTATYRNSGDPTIPTGTVTDGAGFFVGSQTGTNIKLWRNNTLVSQDVQVSMGLSVPNTSMYISAVNGIGGVYSNRQAAFATIGDGLTDAEALALYNTVNNYQVALSRNV